MYNVSLACPISSNVLNNARRSEESLVMSLLGCLPDLNRYFLLVVDKGTEHFVSFPTKTRASPFALLKQFVTLTGRKIRFLRIDGAKE